MHIPDGFFNETDDKLERMAKRPNIKPGSAVLYAGMGTGIFIPFLLSEIGKGGRIIALDHDEKILRQAGAKGFNGNIDYLRADVTNIPLPDETFDIVVCYSSFPYFEDKPKALAEMHRVIKSGGRLLICHTSRGAKTNEIHRQIPVVRNDTIPDGDEIQLLLLMAGFTEIKVEDNSDGYLASAEKSEHSS